MLTRTFGVTTLAKLTKTLPFPMVIVTLAPLTVLSVVLLRMLLYPTVPCTTWHSRMLVNCSVLKFPAADPIAWNAALEGANIVTSDRKSTVWTSFAEVKAPAREVRFTAAAVVESFTGRVRTASMIWRTPPVKLIF